MLYQYTRQCEVCGGEMISMREIFRKTLKSTCSKCHHMEEFHIIFLCNHCKIGKLVHKGTLHGVFGGVEKTVYNYHCDTCEDDRTYDDKLDEYMMGYDID